LVDSCFAKKAKEMCAVLIRCLGLCGCTKIMWVHGVLQTVSLAIVFAKLAAIHSDASLREDIKWKGVAMMFVSGDGFCEIMKRAMKK